MWIKLASLVCFFNGFVVLLGDLILGSELVVSVSRVIEASILIPLLWSRWRQTLGEAFQLLLSLLILVLVFSGVCLGLMPLSASSMFVPGTGIPLGILFDLTLSLLFGACAVRLGQVVQVRHSSGDTHYLKLYFVLECVGHVSPVLVGNLSVVFLVLAHVLLGLFFTSWARSIAGRNEGTEYESP